MAMATAGSLCSVCGGMASVAPPSKNPSTAQRSSASSRKPRVASDGVTGPAALTGRVWTTNRSPEPVCRAPRSVSNLESSFVAREWRSDPVAQSHHHLKISDGYNPGPGLERRMCGPASRVGAGGAIAQAEAGDVKGSRMNPFRFLNWFRSKKGEEVPERTEAKPGEKGNVYYTVKPGDTLESIAREFDIRNQFLLEANDIMNPTNLSPGQVLWIPHVYEVKKGDTLSGIAQKFGVPMSRLQEVNGIEDPDFIYEDDALVVPPTTGREERGAGGQERGGVSSSRF